MRGERCEGAGYKFIGDSGNDPRRFDVRCPQCGRWFAAVKRSCFLIVPEHVYRGTAKYPGPKTFNNVRRRIG